MRDWTRPGLPRAREVPGITFSTRRYRVSEPALRHFRAQAAPAREGGGFDLPAMAGRGW